MNVAPSISIIVPIYTINIAWMEQVRRTYEYYVYLVPTTYMHHFTLFTFILRCSYNSFVLLSPFIDFTLSV